MDKNFLDYTGLTKYTQKIEEFVNSKIAGLVPSTRKVNAKALTSDIILTAYDVDAVPITRQINGHQLGFDLSLTASDVGAVPTSRTVNGKPLTTDITLTASDVSARSSSWTPTASDVGAVPTSRKINAKTLDQDINLTAYDVDAVPITRQINGHQLGFDLSLTASDVGAVPTSRTVNGKPLTTDITLTASDVSARPSSWTPTASDVGAVPTSRTINGKALTSNITLTADDIGIDGGGVGQSMAGQSVKPTNSGTVTAGNGAEIFNDYRERAFISTGAANTGNIASGSYSHAEGSTTTASGSSSHAEGQKTIASGMISHAEGSNTIAESTCTHAEGSATVASGQYSHAEGNSTTSSGNYSHAEGSAVTSSGQYSHAEGYGTTASGESSHAEGYSTTASAKHTHAEGYYTKASNNASHASGKRNKAMSAGGSTENTVGDVFVVGNGTSDSAGSNALRLTYAGQLYLTKEYSSTGADYAEYFEWLDGNPQNEDRVGRFVTLQGDKIKVAEPGDYILGVVSGQPCIIGNGDEDWLGRWEHDDFGRFVKEYLVHNEVEVTPPEGMSNDDLHQWLIANEAIERNGHYFKMEVEVVNYPTASWRHKANPAYDPTQPYIERKDRKEWDAVGMVGVLSVLDDGTCEVNSYAKVSQNGVATKATESEKSWRVIQRVADHVIKIIFYGK